MQCSRQWLWSAEVSCSILRARTLLMLPSSSEWKWPNIPGLDTFEGKLMHSAAWDGQYDLKGKRVAVIGGGSSSVQIVPSIQPRKCKVMWPIDRS